eukprot:1187921-Prorocentrum_minimum.AAC.10
MIRGKIARSELARAPHSGVLKELRLGLTSTLALVTRSNRVIDRWPGPLAGRCRPPRAYRGPAEYPYPGFAARHAPVRCWFEVEVSKGTCKGSCVSNQMVASAIGFFNGDLAPQAAVPDSDLLQSFEDDEETNENHQPWERLASGQFNTEYRKQLEVGPENTSAVPHETF